MSTAKFYKWRSKYSGMDVSLMDRMTKLEAENARLHKLYVKEKLKAKIVTEALEKSGETVLPPQDGPTSSARPRRIDPTGLRDIQDQPDLLPVYHQD